MISVLVSYRVEGMGPLHRANRPSIGETVAEIKASQKRHGLGLGGAAHIAINVNVNKYRCQCHIAVNHEETLRAHS